MSVVCLMISNLDYLVQSIRNVITFVLVVLPVSCLQIVTNV